MKKTKIAMMAIVGLSVIGAQASVITLTNDTNNQQGETRSETNGVAGSTYAPVGDRTLIANLLVGEYYLAAQDRAILTRDVVKFNYDTTTLGGEPLQSAMLRLYVTKNTLNAAGAGSSVQLLYSQTDSTGSANTASDFENTSFALIGTMAGLNSATATGAWYEFDVTASVLDDLANDIVAGTAGSSFRMQLNDDLLLAPGNLGDDHEAEITFTDYSDASGVNAPELVLTVPEPATIGLFVTFGVAIIFIRRRCMMS